MNKRLLGPIDGPMDEAFPMPAPIVLEKMRVACQIPESPMVLNGMSYERQIDEMTGRAATTFRAHIYGRKVREEEHADPPKLTFSVVEHVPASWWDHLKLTIVERWPRTGLSVKYRGVEARTREETTIHKSIYHTCPHLNMETPGRHLSFMQYDGSDGYMPIGLEDKARAAVDAWKRNRPMMSTPEMDAAMHALYRILDRGEH